jgi:hypothetical protein
VSAHALRGGQVRVARYLDLAVLALALPVFLAAGLPLLGFGAVAGAWLVQRWANALLARRARASGDPRSATALLAISMIGRLWFMALAIFGAGMIEREAGLAAALLAIVLVTTYLIVAMAGGPLAAPRERP